MFNWKEFDQTKVLLGQESSYQELSGQHHLTIRPLNLLKWIELVKEDMGFLTLVEMACADLKDQMNSNFRFELTYHLMNMGNHQRLHLHMCFNEDETIPSISEYFIQAEWKEREQAEFFGITFGAPKTGLLLPNGQKNYPQRRDAQFTSWPTEEKATIPELNKNPNKSEEPYSEESYQWKEFDLFSKETLGLFEWQVCFDPTRVVKSNTKIGFHHIGLEKLMAQMGWQKSLQLADKINLGAAPTYGIAWARSIEDLLRIKIPERGQAIRILVLELARIAEHLTVMHEIAHALDMNEHRLFIDAREKIYELVENFCGRRQGYGIIRIGGVKEDLPHGWNVEYQSVFDVIKKNLNLTHKALLGQPKFRENLSSGTISAQSALQWGIGGPAMRAAGLNFDLRKSQPFYFYQDIDFDIPVGINGTAYERYLVRYEEIQQSFRIITQVIDNLPLGEYMNPEFNQNYLEVDKLLQSARGGKSWHYTGVESPNGEAGFLIMVGDKAQLLRAKIKTPSFPIVQALDHFISGINESQLRCNLASLGVRSTELDR